MKNIFQKIILCAFLGALTATLLFGASVGPANAQTINPLVITWEANNYFPADFPGKAMITPGTQVMAAVEEIAGNKLINLSGAQIGWFVNDQLVQSGTGLKSISFTANPDPSGLITVRVQVQAAGGAQFQNAVSILASAPFAIIDYPSIGKTVPAGGTVTLTAWPYFFNVDSLDQLQFTWQTNGQNTTSNQNQLTLQIGSPQSPSQQMLPVTLTTQNTANPLEFSKTISIFNIQ